VFFLCSSQSAVEGEGLQHTRQHTPQHARRLRITRCRRDNGPSSFAGALSLASPPSPLFATTNPTSTSSPPPPPPPLPPCFTTNAFPAALSWPAFDLKSMAASRGNKRTKGLDEGAWFPFKCGGREGVFANFSAFAASFASGMKMRYLESSIPTNAKQIQRSGKSRLLEKPVINALKRCICAIEEKDYQPEQKVDIDAYTSR